MGGNSNQIILGVDGGATKTEWVLCERQGGATRTLKQGKAGSGSLKLLTRKELEALLRSLPQEADRVGVFLAGCATEKDREILRKLATAVWPGAVIRVGSDRESGFAACFGQGDGIAVISGTGSAVTGRREGREERAGGWGHLLGDSGGGYDLAIHALRRVLYDFDTGQRITPLAADTLRALGLNTLRELTGWAHEAEKSDLARLTPLVFRHAEEPGVQAILREGAEALARLTASVAVRLGFEAPTVRLTGGVFTRQALYAELFSEAVRREFPQADVAVCETPASLGAAVLAGELESAPHIPSPAIPIEEELSGLPTEQENARSRDLDRRNAAELVELFVTEEQAVEKAVAACREELTRAVEVTAAALGAGGRLFYAGAGTSGRLGMLDASEMPPTFGVEQEMVQAILAGGVTAFQNSVEGAEDSAEGGAQAIHDRGVRKGDVVCGITASGRTPFVLGALMKARELGARTILLTCNPARVKKATEAEVEIDLPTGAELITGSTRLKAGTATKVALNILSSCTMVLLGKVNGNAMSCLRASNEKLRDRATRIVAERLHIPREEARERLECAKWNIQSVLKPRT